MAQHPRLHLIAGQVRQAKVPYTDDPEQGKTRPVIVIGWSKFGYSEDDVVLVVPVTSFEGNPKVKNGDVELDWQLCGLPKPSWARARRLWGADPRAFTNKIFGSVTQHELDMIYLEIEGLL